MNEMIRSSQDLENKKPLKNIYFYIDDREDPTALFQEVSYVPIPEEGDTIELSEAIWEATGNEIESENADFDVDEEGTYVVDSITYRYVLANYPIDEGEKAEQLFAYVFIEITPVEETE